MSLGPKGMAGPQSGRGFPTFNCCPGLTPIPRVGVDQLTPIRGRFSDVKLLSWVDSHPLLVQSSAEGADEDTLTSVGD